jgi:tetratricopeptide (TPR) repeat protein
MSKRRRDRKSMANATEDSSEARRAEWLARVKAALDTRDLKRATELAEAALANGFEHPLFLNLRAYRLETEGRDDEALRVLLRAVELDPADAQAQNALGLSCFRHGRLADAVNAFRAAAESAPAFSQAHFNLGWALEESGDLNGAEAAYVRAHETGPGAPSPLGKRALLAARRGRWKDAEGLARAALERDAGNPAAALALANVEMEGKNFAAAERRLRDLIARPQLAPLDRANAQGLLGDALHAMGRTGEAFRAYLECNGEFRRAHLDRFAGANRQTVPQYLAALTAHFERAAPWPKRQGGSEGRRRHIFIIGFPRSGTTLIENVLGGAPETVTSDETDGLASGVLEFMQDSPSLDRLAAADESALEVHRRCYWNAMKIRGASELARNFIDKSPYNTIKLPLIARLFPEARIVFVARDPRDVALGCFRQRFRMNPSNFELLTLDGAARFYAATMRLFDLYRAKLPIEICEVRLEDAIADFEATIGKLCAFTGLAWSEDMRNFAERARDRVIATPSANQVARGLDPSASGQWKPYAAEIENILPILAPWVTRFGYS